jgi:rod shape-determining protein MreC
MQKIIDFILKYKDYITFVALVIMSLSFISLDDVNKIGGFRSSVIGTIGWVQNIFSFIPNPIALRNENKALRELNLRLSAEVTKMQNAVFENDKLRELLEYKKKSDISVISTEIVGRTSLEMRNYVSINKGKNAGIKEGMVARTDAGIAGIVVGTSNNYSMVELIKNINVKISAKDQRSKIFGILAWEGGEYFLLKNIPRSYDVKEGDMIVTSEYSNKFPEDIPLGSIVKISEEPGDLFLKVVIQPYVNFNTIEQLFVVTKLPDPEINALIKDVESKYKTVKK